MPYRKTQLNRMITDLETFVKTTCEYDPTRPGQPHDFVGEKCNDAVLMLQEARDALEEDLKAEAKK